MKKAIVLLFIVLFSISSVWAWTTIQEVAITNSTANQTITFDYWNNSGGGSYNLSSVTVELYTTTTGGFHNADNDGATQVTAITIYLGVDFNLLDEDTPPRLFNGSMANVWDNIRTTDSYSTTLAADNGDEYGTVQTDPPDGVAWNATGASDTNTDDIHSSYIAGYIGTGTFNFLLTKSNYIDIAATGGVVFGAYGASTIGGYVKITYIDDNPVPVILSTFTVQYLNESPVLCWTTQSETNNLGWNIYRSETDILEEAIQINAELIPGAGTTSEPTDYVYEDEWELMENTEYWYWLESIDYSGITESYGSISLIIPEQGEDPGSPEIPGIYGLHQNYPNPFNPNTEISFMMKENCIGELSIYNVIGQKIKTLFTSKSIPADELIISNWNGKNESGKEVSTGVYYYKLRTTKENYVRKMILLK